QEYLKATTLLLNYGDLKEIKNLQPFTGLRTLCLNNNQIEVIKNLEYLTHLKKLDLSFNKIKVIENLSSLRSLQELSLHSNAIEHISGLRRLKALQILILANNSITLLSEVEFLRHNIALKCLTLNHNPITKSPNYEEYVYSILKNSLIFLDGKYYKKHDSEIDSSLNMPERNYEVFLSAIYSENQWNSASSCCMFNISLLFVPLEEAMDDLILELLNDSTIPSLLEGIDGFETANDLYRTQLKKAHQNYRLSNVHFFEIMQGKIPNFDRLIQNMEETHTKELIACMKAFTQKRDGSSIDYSSDNDLEDFERYLALKEESCKEKIEAEMDQFEAAFAPLPLRLGESIADIFKLIEDLEEEFSSTVEGHIRSDIEMLEIHLESTGYSDWKKLSSRSDKILNNKMIEEYILKSY
ncbi:hypothetical protein IE077_001178, partial [Cardiosporidium cionae]